jgi:integrase
MSKENKTFSVIFLTKKDKERNGKLPVYMRITVDGCRTDLSMKQWVKQEQWSFIKGMAKGNKAEANELNIFLERARGKILNDYNELLLNNRIITAEVLKRMFLGLDENTRTLLELIDFHNENMQKVLSPGTLKNYYTTRRYVAKFIREYKKSTVVYLSELSYQFLVEFEHFIRLHPLKENSPLENNGLMKHIERMKKIANFGFKLGWISQNPFDLYKLKFRKFDRSFLIQAELDALEAKCFENEHLQTVKDLFIFSCYTGLAPVDLNGLCPDNIITGIDGKKWVHTCRQKTKIPVNIPILPPALALIEKYRNHPAAVNKGTVFPPLSNQDINRNLKIIAEICGIKKHFTFYLARHTFATTVTLSNGVPIETVSKVLGHTKISTTQIYARVLNQKIGNDMAILNEKLRKRNVATTEKNTG